MSIDDSVFFSLLAMDSYNRGYDAGIVITGSGIGNATIGDNATDVLGAQAQAASFFAQAYTWGGKTVISYRGTGQPTSIYNEFM